MKQRSPYTAAKHRAIGYFFLGLLFLANSTIAALMGSGAWAFPAACAFVMGLAIRNPEKE